MAYEKSDLLALLASEDYDGLSYEEAWKKFRTTTVEVNREELLTVDVLVAMFSFATVSALLDWILTASRGETGHGFALLAWNQITGDGMRLKSSVNQAWLATIPVEVLSKAQRDQLTDLIKKTVTLDVAYGVREENFRIDWKTAQAGKGGK